MKRIICIGLILILLLAGCAGHSDEVRLVTREQAAAEQVTIPPEPEPEPSPEEPPAAEFELLAFYGEDGSWQGTRAVARMDMDRVAAMPEAEFAEFCETEIRPLMDGGCAYVTLDYQNGTGLVFFGGFSPIYYETIDGDGAILEVSRYYYLEDGRLSCEDPVPALTPAPEPVRQTPADSGRNYVINTNTGKFHFPECSSVKDIKDKNRQDYHGTREEIIAMGYDPCKRCNP